MSLCWGRIIRVLWCSVVLLATAQRDSPESLLGAGRAAIDRGQYAEAERQLKAIGGRLAPIADYVHFSLAQSLLGQRKFEEAFQAVQPALGVAPPLQPEAALLAARARLEAGSPQEAIALLRTEKRPEGILLLAKALEASKQPGAAAIEFQRIYHEFPVSPQAAEAAGAMARLQRSLAGAYPAPPASVRIARASRLTVAGRTTQSITELQEIAASSDGGDRDVARVRLGAARYEARRDAAAHDYLRKLSVAPGEADAERWYYIAATARRLGRADAMREALDALDAQYPTSRWRLEALLSAASQALVENQVQEYEPLYRACFEDFASDPRAALCHWKVAWIAYRQSRSDRTPMLREHVRRYPDSENVATALYFLGRIAATGGDPAAAKAYLEKVVSRYPNYYYALLAREQLSDSAIARAQPSDAANMLALRSPRLPGSFRPDAATQRRLERARLLRLAGLNEWAEGELQFGARTDAQPHVAGLEMARAAAERGEHRRGVHLLRQAGLEYLEWPFEAAPLEFWRTAFPLPYRDLVEKYSQDNEIDVFLVAGLIRQESAFDPRAVSRARAMGLTQVRPLTGRDLSRRLGLRGFTSSMLFRPEVNLRLGTFHLRNTIEEFEGRMELVLASYNAGRSRALAWKDWGTFQEPAEFIETIPFTETRGYVQAVLRNAAMYRRLYGGSASANGAGR